MQPHYCRMTYLMEFNNVVITLERNLGALGAQIPPEARGMASELNWGSVGYYAPERNFSCPGPP